MKLPLFLTFLLIFTLAFSDPRDAAAPITAQNVPHLEHQELVPGYNADQVTFSPDGSRLAFITNQSETRIQLFDLLTRQLLEPLESSSPVTAMAFAPDGRLLSSHLDGGLRTWQLGERTFLDNLLRHNGELWSTAVSPDGSVFATSATFLRSGDTQNAVVRLWDFQRQRWYSQGSTLILQNLTFSGDGSLLAASGSGYTITDYDHLPIHVWEVASGDELAILDAHTTPIKDLAFSPDGRWLVSASDDGLLFVWDITAVVHQAVREPAYTLQLETDFADDQIYLNAVTFSPDGSLIIAAHGSLFTLERLVFWDVDQVVNHNSTAPAAIYESEFGFNDLAFNADGTLLVTVGNYEPDAGIWLWQVGN